MYKEYVFISLVPNKGFMKSVFWGMKLPHKTIKFDVSTIFVLWKEWKSKYFVFFVSHNSEYAVTN